MSDDIERPNMELPAPLAAVINLTCNVVCRLCGWTSVYPMSAYEIAAKQAANHVTERHSAETAKMLADLEEAP